MGSFKTSSAAAACSTNKRCLLVVLALLVMCASLSQGRYLPTRSDDSRRERIKEVLRLLLDLSDAEAEAQGMSGASGQGLRGGPSFYDLQGGNGPSAGRGLIAKRSAIPENTLSRSLEATGV